MGRFDRQRLMDWWDEGRIAVSRACVIGAGALGNELAKNLILSGFVHLAIVDMDLVEESNLSRSVLFRREDVGAPKAQAAARALSSLWPEASPEPVECDVRELDERFFARFDIIFGCLDNVEARMHANAHALAAGLPYLDAGTDGLRGKLHVVLPRERGCLECLANSTHARAVGTRYSCTGAARKDLQPVASELTTTALVAAIQAREGLKLACGAMDLALHGLTVYDGATGQLDRFDIPRSPTCPHHARPSNLRNKDELWVMCGHDEHPQQSR